MNFVSLSNLRPFGRAALVGVAALAAATGAVGSAAASDLEVSSFHIAFSPADAATPAGAQHLMRRIEMAANWVCGDQHRLDLAQRDEVRRCRAQAIDRAVRDAQVPMLAALAQRPGAPLTVAGR